MLKLRHLDRALRYEARMDELKARQEVGAGETADQCPAPSCDECPERGDCAAEENAREATERHNAEVS